MGKPNRKMNAALITIAVPKFNATLGLLETDVTDLAGLAKDLTNLYKSTHSGGATFVGAELITDTKAMELWNTAPVAHRKGHKLPLNGNGYVVSLSPLT